jgi:hypothetical protein
MSKLTQNKELKFIDFKKASDTNESSPASDLRLKNESSKTCDESSSPVKFYLRLINQESESIKSEQNILVKKEECFPNLPKQFDFKPKDLLKAAQSNNLEYIRKSAENKFDLTVLDDFKWNILMIAIAEKNNSIVEFVLNELNDLDLLNKLLDNKDSSQNDAKKLAETFKNNKALELIEHFYKKFENTRRPKSIEIEIEDNIDENFYCESCKKNFSICDESHIEHMKSIVHQLNEIEQDNELARRKFANFHLKRNNKGYQMLMKLGWDEASGLGVNEQGRMNPIRTRLKLDRLGLGIEEKEGEKSTEIEKIKLVHPKKIFKLKTNSKMSDGVCLKEYKNKYKNEQKAKKFERNLRRYFDE